MQLLGSCFLRVCYCTQGRLHFCGYMRGSSQLSSGSSQLSSARVLLCVSTLNGTKLSYDIDIRVLSMVMAWLHQR